MLIKVDKDISEAAGGKARGLALLIRCGLYVPPAVVITSPEQATWEEDLKAYLAENPGKAFAVRSSALEEDGEKSSFAGQFDSYLNRVGYEEIKEAVLQCFASAKNLRAKAYSESMHHEDNPGMAVIVQGKKKVNRKEKCTRMKEWAGLLM